MFSENKGVQFNGRKFGVHCGSPGPSALHPAATPTMGLARGGLLREKGTPQT